MDLKAGDRVKSLKAISGEKGDTHDRFELKRGDIGTVLAVSYEKCKIPIFLVKMDVDKKSYNLTRNDLEPLEQDLFDFKGSKNLPIDLDWEDYEVFNRN